MRKPYGKLIVILAAITLVTGGCQKKGNTVETDASTEAVVTESATAREPISEETWSWLVQTYKLLEANYETGQKLVEDGLATQTEDPEEVIAEAKRLLDYGEQCGKEDMMEEDGQDLLYDMVSASNRLMDLIEKNGGTAVTMDEAVGKETEAAPITGSSNRDGRGSGSSGCRNRAGSTGIGTRCRTGKRSTAGCGRKPDTGRRTVGKERDHAASRIKD